MSEASSSPSAGDADRYRYGVYVRPSPEMIDAACRAMDLVERQYGCTAAAAYPPHITILGSIPLLGSEEALLEAVGDELARHRSFEVFNAGFTAQIRDGIGVRLDRLRGGEQNLRWHALFAGLARATASLRGYVASDWAAAGRAADERLGRFSAHLTVLGHDGAAIPELVPEAQSVLEALDLAGPANWTVDTVTAYRLQSEAWSGEYWHSLTWTPMRSWRLSDAEPQRS